MYSYCAVIKMNVSKMPAPRLTTMIVETGEENKS